MSLLGAALFGTLVFLLLPASVVPLDDDFGYLRSLVETARRGRPWTDDWLEPWSASLSVLAATVFRATGSFSLAVHGTLAAAGAAAVGGVAALLRARGFNAGRALGFSALLLTFPTLLWKEVQFTGMAVYLPCLLWALWAAERRRWGWFMLPWAVGMATRQSALVWGALPLAELCRLWRVHDGTGKTTSSPARQWVEVVVVGLAGLSIFLGLSGSMNKTHAQRLRTDHAFDHLVWREVFGWGLVGALVFLGLAGVGAVVLRWRAVNLSVRWPGGTALALAVIFALLALCVDVRGVVSVEHPLFASPGGWYYAKLMLLLASIGWLTGDFTLRPSHAVAAAACLALVSLRGAVWDYYLVDVAVFAFFAPVATAVADRETAPAGVRLPWWTWAVPAVVLCFHLTFIGELKVFLDRARGLCLLGEGALRTGRMEAAESGFAPFGFLGWHLYPWFVAHEGREDADIAGFTRYLRPGAVEVGQGYSEELKVFPRFQHDPPADRQNLLASGRYRMLWFYQGEYYLLRFKTPAENPAPLVLPPDFRAPIFPLNDAEWRELVASPVRP